VDQLNNKKMIKNVIIFLAIVIFFANGVAVGIIYEKKQNAMIVSEQKKISLENSKKAILNLDLLKDYLNFVFSPQESNPDPNQTAANLEKKAQLLNDADVMKKFYATGDQDGKEQKISDFFNSLIVNIGKSCVQQK
jgi:hypothetical protein